MITLASGRSRATSPTLEMMMTFHLGSGGVKEEGEGGEGGERERPGEGDMGEQVRVRAWQ